MQRYSYEEMVLLRLLELNNLMLTAPGNGGC